VAQFLNVITKAKTACEVPDHAVDNHFVDVTKMVELGSGSQHEISDIMLTRYTCYLIAQNGDARKQKSTASYPSFPRMRESIWGKAI